MGDFDSTEDGLLEIIAELRKKIDRKNRTIRGLRMSLKQQKIYINWFQHFVYNKIGGVVVSRKTKEELEQLLLEK